MMMMSDCALKSFNDWELVATIGSGSYGEVLQWRNEKLQIEIATKSLKANPNLQPDEEYKIKLRWKLEFENINKVDTPYIVRGIQVKDNEFVEYLKRNHAWSPLPVIIMEYCNGGDLRSHLRKIQNLNGLPEFQVREILHAMRHAIEYLHDKCKIEHRDLKPDNIIANKINGKICYKLTDLGFACAATDHTALKSLVGSRHYFAPEVVDLGKYTKTVDYWSLGIIAFEMMCGILPFIPYQNIVNIMNSIKNKSNDCIAISESIDELNKFHQHTTLFKENHMSSVFALKIENWLRSALNKDHRLRGSRFIDVNPESTNARKLTFYTELDHILSVKILSVFCINDYTFYYYEVDENLEMDALFDAMENDMKKSKSFFQLILPVGHPLKRIDGARPIDLLYENGEKIYAMIYIVFNQCEYTITQTPYVTETIKHCIKLNPNANPANWIKQEFERHVYFLLTQEKYHLEALIDGLENFGMTIEDKLVEFGDVIKDLQNRVLVLQGNFQQFSISVERSLEEVQKMPMMNFALLSVWNDKAKAFTEKVSQCKSIIYHNIVDRHRSALRRIKEEIINIKKIPKEDIFNLNSFHMYSNMRGLFKFCKDIVYKCLVDRQSFLNGLRLRNVHRTINEIQLEFFKIIELVKNIEGFTNEMKRTLTEATGDFQLALLNLKTIPKNALQTSLNKNFSEMKSSMFAYPTSDILSTTLDLMEKMELDIGDEESSYLPTTIE